MSRMIDARIDRLVVDVGALVDAGEEAVAPQLRPDHGFAGTEDDVAGQVLVVRAEGVGQPGAQAGPDRLHVARVHHQQARLVVGVVGVHRANDADVIDALGHLGVQLADLDAALAVLLGLERRGHQLADPGPAGLLEQSIGHRLTVQLFQARLGVEGIDVRRTAVHEQEDHPFGPGGKVRSPWSQRIDGRFRCRSGSNQTGVGQDRGQAQSAKPAADPTEHLTTRQDAGTGGGRWEG